MISNSKICTIAVLFSVLVLPASDVSAQLFPTYVNGAFTLGNAAGSSSPYALSDTFLLESNPNASKTIYLDFDGYHSINNTWAHSNGPGIVFDAFDTDGNLNSFSNGELTQIQQQFQNVAEDFIGFDVNVTTRVFGNDNIEKLRRDGANDNEWGIRSVNTQSIPNGFGSGTGGIAYVNSFSWTNNDSPVFAFNKGENNGAMTNSHEVGHAMGLRHHGLNGSSYHPGQGSGETSWGPTMGAPFGANVTQWSDGNYSGATISQDDLALITGGNNGFGYRVDDKGDTFATATQVTSVGSLMNVVEWGIVEENTDIDMFEFNFTAGTLNLDIVPFEGRPNLDVLAKLYDQNGSLLATSDPTATLDASFTNISIGTSGTYYLSVEGTGLAGEYSSYGSLGFYTVNANFISSVPEPASLGVLGIIGGLLLTRRRRT